MARSFGRVDHKVAEADFFLTSIPECDFDLFAVRSYVGAFAASARSVTFSLQAVLRKTEGFGNWYSRWQDRLQGDDTARFFHDLRTANQHMGDNPVSGGSSSLSRPIQYWFRATEDIPVVPSEDVFTVCNAYIKTIVELVYDCYVVLGPHVDAHQHYTADHFARIGKTIEDAEEELFGFRGWTASPDLPVEYRWQIIRDSQPGCEINHLFEKYLGKTAPAPERLPDLPLPSGEGWHQLPDGGRVHIPRALRQTGDPQKDIEMYLRRLGESRGRGPMSDSP